MEWAEHAHGTAAREDTHSAIRSSMVVMEFYTRKYGGLGRRTKGRSGNRYSGGSDESYLGPMEGNPQSASEGYLTKTAFLEETRRETRRGVSICQSNSPNSRGKISWIALVYICTCPLRGI